MEGKIKILEEKILSFEQQIVSLKEDVYRHEQELVGAKLWQSAPNKKCLTFKEVAEWIGCSENTVRDYENKGLLVAMYPNAKKKFHYSDVERFLAGEAPNKKRKVRVST